MERLSCCYGQTLLVLLCDLRQVASALWASASSPIKRWDWGKSADGASSLLEAHNLYSYSWKNGAATPGHRHGSKLFLTSKQH